jgi:hypothetical protein
LNEGQFIIKKRRRPWQQKGWLGDNKYVPGLGMIVVFYLYGKNKNLIEFK